jgi:hypothetical protein
MALTPRFEEALVFAARLHGGDVRKGTTIPYVSHVLGVASLALEHGANEDEAIGALLHDTVEDAKGDSESVRTEIRRRFGAAGPRHRRRLHRRADQAEASVPGTQGTLHCPSPRGLSVSPPGLGLRRALQCPRHSQRLPGHW